MSTMNCRSAEKQLSDLAAGELAGAVAGDVERHVAGCGDCRQRLEELEATIGLLRRVGDEELPDGYGAELHRKLVAAGPPPPAGVWVKVRAALGWRPLGWIAMGTAAALLLLIGLRLGARRTEAPTVHAATPTTPPPTPAPQPQMATTPGPVEPTFHVPAARLAMIKIDFVADESVEDVTFAVTLPEGLHFVSGGKELAEREFQWQGSLKAGSNLVPVTVRGRKAGIYTVAARASGRGVEVKHEVRLEVIAG